MTSAQHRKGVTPVNSSWWLEAVCLLDSHAPGFASAALKANDARRQFIAAGLSVPRVHSLGLGQMVLPVSGVLRPLDKMPAADVARLLLTGSAREIAERVFGSCPPGFRRVLGLIGSEPESRQFYPRLHSALSSPEKRAVARILLHTQHVNMDRLRLAERLPPIFQRPGILDKIPSHQVGDVFAALDLIRSICPTATEAALRESVRSMVRGKSLPWFIHSWVKRATLPPPPVPGDELVAPLTTVKAMHRFAVTFRNCLRTMVVPALKGEVYFYECTLAGHVVLAHLAHRQGTWIVRDVYAVANRTVPGAVRRAVVDWFAQAGVKPLSNPQNRTWRMIAYMCDEHDRRSLIHVNAQELNGLMEEIDAELDALL